MLKGLVAALGLFTVVGVEWPGLKPGNAASTKPTTAVPEVVEPIPVPVPVVSVPVVDLDAIPALQKLRQDFDLQVKMIGGTDHPDGVRRFNVDDLVRFEITPSRDCWIAIWSVNADGTVDQILPHPTEVDKLLPADQTSNLPHTVEIAMLPSGGVDQAWILASNRPWNPMLAVAKTDLQSFLNNRTSKNFEHFRRAVQTRSEIQLSETMVRFLVVPSKK